jgi:hypothetical protein
MVESEARMVRVTDHALAKAEMLGIARTDVEQAVLERHRERRHNTRAADWVMRAGRLAIAYDHPHGDDDALALVWDSLAYGPGSMR